MAMRQLFSEMYANETLMHHATPSLSSHIPLVLDNCVNYGMFAFFQCIISAHELLVHLKLCTKPVPNSSAFRNSKVHGFSDLA